MSVLDLGLGSRKSNKVEDLEAAYRELNDVCILRLLEALLEAAPQLVLQVYIVLIDLNNFNTLLGTYRIFLSFVISIPSFKEIRDTCITFMCLEEPHLSYLVASDIKLTTTSCFTLKFQQSIKDNLLVS